MYCFLGVEVQLRITTSDDATLPADTDLLSRLQEMKLRHFAQSEGYETMMQYSSDIVSQVTRSLYLLSTYMVFKKNLSKILVMQSTFSRNAQS